jgi:hypothetical protein
MIARSQVGFNLRSSKQVVSFNSSVHFLENSGWRLRRRRHSRELLNEPCRHGPLGHEGLSELKNSSCFNISLGVLKATCFADQIHHGVMRPALSNQLPGHLPFKCGNTRAKVVDSESVAKSLCPLQLEQQASLGTN